MMKVYRVAYRDESDEHQGYEFFTVKTDAVKADKTNDGNQTRDDIGEFEFPLTKKGVMDLLAWVACHPDNG
jgi:hypothetical protein